MVYNSGQIRFLLIVRFYCCKTKELNIIIERSILEIKRAKLIGHIDMAHSIVTRVTYASFIELWRKAL